MIDEALCCWGGSKRAPEGRGRRFCSSFPFTPQFLLQRTSGCSVWGFWSPGRGCEPLTRCQLGPGASTGLASRGGQLVRPSAASGAVQALAPVRFVLAGLCWGSRSGKEEAEGWGQQPPWWAVGWGPSCRQHWGRCRLPAAAEELSSRWGGRSWAHFPGHRPQHASGSIFRPLGRDP